MTCRRCHKPVRTLDGHCKPCRRHLGLEPVQSRAPGEKRPEPDYPRRKRGVSISRKEAKALHRRAIAELNQKIERTRPSLPQVKWLDREMPE